MRNSELESSLIPEEDVFFESLNNTRDSIFVPELGIFYQRVPKVAGTKISYMIFSYLFDDPKCEVLGDANVHFATAVLIPKLTDYPRRYVYEKLHSDEFLKFSFVRNPYTRLISCYKDKFARLGEIKDMVQKKSTVARSLEEESHFYEEPKYIPYSLQIHANAGKELYLPYTDKFEPVSFEEFVNFVCSQEYQDMDHHWQPQTIITNFDEIAYDFVGKMENFTEDMTYVLDKLNAPSFLYQDLDEKINPTKREKPTRDYYTPELQEMVYEKYRDDFEAFIYPIELPEYY